MHVYTVMIYILVRAQSVKGHVIGNIPLGMDEFDALLGDSGLPANYNDKMPMAAAMGPAAPGYEPPPLPPSFSWKDQNMISPVRSQQRCVLYRKQFFDQKNAHGMKIITHHKIQSQHAANLKFSSVTKMMGLHTAFEFRGIFVVQ